MIDDGSTDNTAELAAACDDATGRLHVIRKANGGPGSAVNRGRDASHAPYFCVLDADDVFLPNRLADILRRAPDGWDLAADRLWLAEDGRRDGPYTPWAGRIPASGRISFETFVRGNITDPSRPRTELGYLQPIYRRAFMDRTAVRHSEGMRLGEDYLVYATALARGARFVVTETRGYVAVARPGSLSRSHSVEDLEAVRAADDQLRAEPGLRPREIEALKAHASHLDRKIAYRRALGAKAAGDLAGALKLCARDMGTLLYVADQTARAKFRGMAHAGRGLVPSGG